MGSPAIHRFIRNGKRYALDTETCFCFECDEISWDVLDYFPHTSVSRIHQLLADRHPAQEINEVIGELEWLRATKSILRPLDKATLESMFEAEQGLRLLTVRVAPESPADASVKPERTPRWPFGRGSRPNDSAAPATSGVLLRNAATLLMSRSGPQKNLELRVLGDTPAAFSPALCDVLCQILKTATLSGKELCLSLAAGVSKMDGHTWEPRVDVTRPEAVQAAIRALESADRGDPKKCAKAFAQLPDGATGRVRLIPGHPDYGKVVPSLREAGFAVIELDLDTYFAGGGDSATAPDAMLSALEATATYYADELLQGRYFRLDPIAPVFWRVYQGQPIRRVDPVGTQELAADENGMLYPSRHWIGRDAFRCGSLADGTVDANRLGCYEDVGSVTTAECIGCWAHNLCGGGCAAVHEARTGSFRHPDPAWCAFQREWMAAAVVAFDRLAAEGVNFTRVYQNLRPAAKPSLMTLARAAFRMSIGMRPIEENDAELLTEWENWTESAYFLCGENGLLLATKYDREMDALHPAGISQEFLLLRKDSTPFGLMRLSPDRWEGTARAWLYFRDEKDYAEDAVRKSFRFLLKEAAGDQKLRRLTTLALAKEASLCAFLEGIGFESAGLLRDAVFLHGEYVPARVYVLAAENL